MKFPRRLAIPFVLAALHAAAGGSSVRADDGDEVDQGDGFVVPPPPEAQALAAELVEKAEKAGVVEEEVKVVEVVTVKVVKEEVKEEVKDAPRFSSRCTCPC